MKSIIWFRGKDLRLTDHPAFDAAGPDALLIFVVDPYFFRPKSAQRLPHRMQYMLDALVSLEKSVAERGGKLWFIEGRSTTVIPKLAKAFEADQVVAMRWSEPFGRERDRRIAGSLDIPLVLLEGETLLPPGQIRTQGGTPYTVFTPFAKRFRSQYHAPRGSAVPRELVPVDLPPGFQGVSCPTVQDLGIAKNERLIHGGEKPAKQRLAQFLRKGNPASYGRDRNRMDIAGTSRISADLKFGVLSVGEVWRQTVASSLKDVDKRSFLNELIWREFNYHTLWDHPKILSAPFKSKWAKFPWAEPPDHLDAWKQGRTGYPVVDAAARQLLATGFVHNRARMVAASFLTKHLMLDFRLGEDHYLRWLVDGDWAQNCMGWQWAAGCGADAQPWFRIFNPVTQGKKFDPDGTYVRQWVPELRALDKRYIHAPWSAPPQVLERAKIQLGVEYPRPVVDHAWARERFLSTAKTFFSGDESPATTPPPRQEKAVPRQGRLFDMRVDGADLGRGKTEGDKDGWSPSRGWGKKAETEAPP